MDQRNRHRVELLAELWRLGLLQIAGEGEGFTLYELTDLAREAQGLSGHLDAVRKEFAAAKSLLNDDEHPWMGMDRAQRDNMRTIIEWALEGRSRPRKPELG